MLTSLYSGKANLLIYGSVTKFPVSMPPPQAASLEVAIERVKYSLVSTD